MKKSWIVVISLTCFLVMCTPKDEFASFTNQQLVEILYDVHLANGIAESGPKNISDSLRNHFLNQISEIHDIERENLDSIINRLHFNNARYLIIYDSIERKINREIKTKNLLKKEDISKKKK